MPARQATKKRVKGPNGKFMWVPIEDAYPPLPAAQEMERVEPTAFEPLPSVVGQASVGPYPVRMTPEPEYFDPWYHPKYEGITLRPTPNEAIRFEGYKAVPRNAKEDEYLRDWITRQRRGNDPERWHGDTPGLRDMTCPYCKGGFRNQDVYEDHLQIKHLREDLGDERMR